MAKSKLIRVVRLPVAGQPLVVTIENSLVEKQKIVGGLIEPVDIDQQRVIYLNEEALLEEAPVNQNVTVIWQRLNHDPLGIGNNGWGYRGEGFICRNNNNGDDVSLTDEDIVWLVDLLGPISREQKMSDDELRATFA